MNQYLAPEGISGKQIGRTDGLTVIIVHTYGSCKISIPSLLNIVVIDNFDFHIFQFKIDFVVLADFYVLNSPNSVATVSHISGWTKLK